MGELSFRELLILKEMQGVGSDYDLSEIAETLGLTYLQLYHCLAKLIDESYLTYEGLILELTDRGVVALVGNNLYISSNNSVQGLNTSRTSMLNPDQPVVPKRFIERQRLKRRETARIKAEPPDS